MRNAISHVGRLWGPLFLIPLLPAFYALALFAFGELRPEHVVMALVCAGLAFASVRTKQFFVDVLPYVTVALSYDALRYVRPLLVTSERVIGCGMRRAELALFSVAPDTTLQDYFSIHHSPAFDLLFAVPYTIFLYVAIIYAGFLFFRDRRRMRHYVLSFALANFVSFAFWLILPAAPPWYLRSHGCNIDIHAVPDAAGLLRVDAFLGIHYFEKFYARAASVFGALPSMHCAYPMLGLLTAFRAATRWTWPIHVAYTLIMACAAVYLDHHWVIDVLVGWLVAIVTVLAADRLVDRVFASVAAPALDSVPVPASDA